MDNWDNLTHKRITWHETWWIKIKKIVYSQVLWNCTEHGSFKVFAAEKLIGNRPIIVQICLFPFLYTEATIAFFNTTTRFGTCIIELTSHPLRASLTQSHLLSSTPTYFALNYATPTHLHSHPFSRKISSHLPTLIHSQPFSPKISRDLPTHPFSAKMSMLWLTPTNSSLNLTHNHQLWLTPTHFVVKLAHVHPLRHTLKDY